MYICRRHFSYYMDFILFFPMQNLCKTGVGSGGGEGGEGSSWLVWSELTTSSVWAKKTLRRQNWYGPHLDKNTQTLGSSFHGKSARGDLEKNHISVLGDKVNCKALVTNLKEEKNLSPRKLTKHFHAWPHYLVLDRPVRGKALLDSLFINVEALIKEVKTEGSLGCRDHALAEFVILRNTGLAKSRVRILKFRRVKFWLFKELLHEIPWESPTLAELSLSSTNWQVCTCLLLVVDCWEMHENVVVLEIKSEETITSSHQIFCAWDRFSPKQAISSPARRDSPLAASSCWALGSHQAVLNTSGTIRTPRDLLAIIRPWCSSHS